MTKMNAAKCCKSVDRVFDALLGCLGCEDSRDAILMSHWQEGANPGFRIQVTRRSDGKTLIKFVGQSGNVEV